jgi:hypothetical protein
MKIIGIAVVRTGSDLNEPIPLTVANDLSSFGFFQRQVWQCLSSVLYQCNITVRTMRALGGLFLSLGRSMSLPLDSLFPLYCLRYLLVTGTLAHLMPIYASFR